MKTKAKLVLYNSLTRQKEQFTPIKAGEINMYVCGMTVYDRCHLGHGRSMVCFDVMVRFFRYLGYKVTFVRNITDIDDKPFSAKGISILIIDDNEMACESLVSILQHEFSVEYTTSPERALEKLYRK